MYICMLCVSILTFYECSFRFYNCYDSVVFVFFHLIIHEYITTKSNTLIKEHFDLMTKLKQKKKKTQPNNIRAGLDGGLDMVIYV